MRCLLCGRELGKGSLRDVMIGDDPICEACRKQWKKRKIHFLLNGIRVDSDYVYNEAFASCLIQYKESRDEALKDTFLYEVKRKLKIRYRGYTLLMMPSSTEKQKERGFSHLKRMYECIGLPIMEPFEKMENLSQKGMNKEERKKMSSEIRLVNSHAVPEKIVLCDDTVTTGATLEGALSCLNRKEHSIRIYAVSANERWLKGRPLHR
jgi:competence protein ComFC